MKSKNDVIRELVLVSRSIGVIAEGLAEIWEIDAASTLSLRPEHGRVYANEAYRNRDLLTQPISRLNLSTRAHNCLEREDIELVGELTTRSPRELLELRSFGRTTLREVRRKLEDVGLSLKADRR